MKHIQFSVLVHTPVTIEPFSAPAGVAVSDVDRVIYFDAAGLSLLSMIIGFTGGVTAQVLGSWLYDRFVKPKTSKPAKEIKINERIITAASREQFIQVLEREITRTEEQE